MSLQETERLTLGKDEVLKTFGQLADNVLAPLPFEVAHMEWGTEAGTRILRLFIERKDGSKVGIEDCREASRALDAVLETDDPIPFAYTLEVSSPGLDRPLARLRDFRAVQGKVITLETENAVHGRKRFHGRLKLVADDQLTVTIDGKDFVVPLDQ